MGNITETRDDVATETSTYGYDALDRLTSWTMNSQTETYTYDSSTGNLASKAGITYTYDTNHPHAVASLSNGNTYSQDANGNQTTRVIGSDTYTLFYDAENRMVEVKKNSTTIATFAYDGDGRQVKSVVSSTTTYFPGMHYMVEGGTVTKYYFAGASRVAFRVASTLYYPLSDHLGSTSLTTDPSGILMSELRYKPWGETRYTSGTTATSYRYTGQREESSFGLYFYNARWYDPALGRFAQADTIIPQSQGIQGWDRYAYANNNSIRYLDPTGQTIPLIFIGIGIIAVAGFALVVALAADPEDVNALAESMVASVCDLPTSMEEASSNIESQVLAPFTMAILYVGETVESELALAFAHKPDIDFIDYLTKKYGLTKAERRLLHDEITRQGLTEAELEEEAAEIARQKMQEKRQEKKDSEESE